MSFKHGDADCTFRCWMIGGVVGLLGMLLLWLAGPSGFLGALFWGLLLAIVTGLVLSYLLCRAAPGEAEAVTSGTVTASAFEDYKAANSDPVAAPEPELAPVPPVAPAEVPDPVAEAEESVAGQPPAATPGAEEPAPVAAPAEPVSRPDVEEPAKPAAAAERAEAAPVPAPAAPVAVAPADLPTAPDFDGDGVHEGAGEGSRPEMLAAAREGGPDDLKKIKGVGPKLEAMLHELGFYHFDQIASWSADEVAWVDANLTGFKGRVSRDNWVAQARDLAAGHETAFSSRVDKGEVY